MNPKPAAKIATIRVEVVDGQPLTAAQIDILELRIYPHRRAAYANEFAALRAGTSLGKRQWEEQRRAQAIARAEGARDLAIRSRDQKRRAEAVRLAPKSVRNSTAERFVLGGLEEENAARSKAGKPLHGSVESGRAGCTCVACAEAVRVHRQVHKPRRRTA